MHARGSAGDFLEQAVNQLHVILLIHGCVRANSSRANSWRASRLARLHPRLPVPTCRPQGWRAAPTASISLRVASNFSRFQTCFTLAHLRVTRAVRRTSEYVSMRLLSSL